MLFLVKEETVSNMTEDLIVKPDDNNVVISHSEKDEGISEKEARRLQENEMMKEKKMIVKDILNEFCGDRADDVVQSIFDVLKMEKLLHDSIV